MNSIHLFTIYLLHIEKYGMYIESKFSKLNKVFHLVKKLDFNFVRDSSHYKYQEPNHHKKL